MAKRSYGDITAQVEAAKQSAIDIANKGKKLNWYLEAFIPSISSSLFKDSGVTTAEGVEQYCDFIDKQLDNGAVYINCLIKDKKGTEYMKLRILVRDEYEDEDGTIVSVARSNNTSENNTSTENSVLSGMNAVLSLLGFAPQSLDGVDATSPMGQISSIMQARDQMTRNEIIAQLQGKEKERVENENEELKEKLKEMEEKMLANSKQLETMKEQLEEAQERVAELEKMKPENSIAGVALSSLGGSILANAGQALARRNAGLLAGLFGINKEQMLGMLDGQDVVEEPQPTKPQAEPQMSMDVPFTEEQEGDTVY